MTTRRNFLKSGGLSLAGLLVGQKSFAHLTESATPGAPLVSNTLQYTCQRPAPEKRQFTSAAVEKAIQTTKAKLKDPKLAWMFENCFPNTLDTTCEHKMVNGKPDTFVLTGDIHAMWLRDSSAQVFPHIILQMKTRSKDNAGRCYQPPDLVYQHRPVCQRFQRRPDRQRMGK